MNITASKGADYVVTVQGGGVCLSRKNNTIFMQRADVLNIFAAICNYLETTKENK